MADMIERVAAALWRGSNKQLRSDEAWGDAFELAKDAFRELAHAAIEAMREPTKEMLLAGESYDLDLTQEGAAEVWHAMLSAALADPPA